MTLTRSLLVRRVPTIVRHRRVLAWALGALGAIVGGAASWVPSFWGDEAASVMSAARSWPSLTTLLGTIDGVHGVYYSLLHVWTAVFGASEFSTRFPSALAAGLMVTGTVFLALEYVPTSAAACAGIIAIVLSRTTYMATEARSYALSAAAAVWLTLLLVRILRAPVRRLAWLGYAVAMAAGMYLFLYLGLLCVVHGVFIAIAHRDRLRTWAWSAAVSVALASPIILIGYVQRDQISFLARRHYATVSNVLVKQWFGQPLVAVVCWALIVAAILLLVRARRDADAADHRRRSLVILATTWLILPTMVLLVINATISPLYNVRYLSFCAPAAAVMMAMGATAIGRLVTLRLRPFLVSALLAAVLLSAVPVYGSQRTPWAKDGGSDLSGVASYLTAHTAHGDAIIFDQGTKPSRDPRLAVHLYPSAFSSLDDIALRTPYQQSSGLWDVVADNEGAIPQNSRPPSVWAVELAKSGAEPTDIAMLTSLGYSVVSRHLVHRSTIFHAIKE